MFLIILGVIVLIASFVVSSANPQFSHFNKYVRTVAVVLMLIGVMTACFVQIDAGYIGVKKLFGKIQPDVLTSGLHLINPLLEIEKMDIKTKNYTMSGVNDEGRKTGDDAMKVLTADGLEVIVDLSILYRVIPTSAPMLLAETGNDYEDKVVRPITRTRIRDNAVNHDAIALYSTKRNEFQQTIFETINQDFKKRGLLLEQLLVRNITLPQSVKSAIEQKINAEQEAQKMQFVLQKEKQEAERKRVEAQGIADYQRIINLSLTDKQLQYESIKAQLKLAESPNAKVLIMGNSRTPIIIDSK